MAELATIARPYAEALFRVAPKSGGICAPGPPVVEELAQVARLPERAGVRRQPEASAAQQIGDTVPVRCVKSPLAQDSSSEELRAACWSRTAASALLPEIAAQFRRAEERPRRGGRCADRRARFPLEGEQLNDLVASAGTQVSAASCNLHVDDGPVADRRRARRRWATKCSIPRSARARQQCRRRLTA